VLRAAIAPVDVNPKYPAPEGHVAVTADAVASEKPIATIAFVGRFVGVAKVTALLGEERLKT
jgi:hypothetical protein